MTAFELAGKRALVVGAEGQAGRAIGLALAEAGADVALVAATADPAAAFALRRLGGQVEALGRRSLTQATDVTSSQGAQVMVRQVAKELGGLDVLVNAAGLYLGKPFEKVSDAEWARVLGLNLNATFFTCRAAVREMLRGEGGRIVNVVSLLALRGLSHSAAYCAAQAAVVNLSRALALEYAGRGIRVNCIVHGWLEGMPGAGEAAAENPLVRFIPMRRLGRAAELGPLAVYLASDAADYLTGQTYAVDGGVLQHL
ncbi:MAG TPA: SDR family oxidoreductase [Dehalococcoidia bacterium]